MENSLDGKIRVLLVPSEGIVRLKGKPDYLSDNTRARCERALKAWNTGEYDIMVITGGKFSPPSEQTRPAADLMFDWFTRRGRGVRNDQVILETKSLDTYQNIQNSLYEIRRFVNSKLLHVRKGDEDEHFEIHVCTEFLHGLRFWVTFARAYGIWVKVIPVRQPRMTVMQVVLEMLVLIPLHVIDPFGNNWVSKRERRKRQEAARRRG